jgi:flavin-dependent dehydrogenase
MAPIPAASHSEPDFLIVGAGPTGLTLAMALTARGMRTIAIDRTYTAVTSQGRIPSLTPSQLIRKSRSFARERRFAPKPYSVQ